MVLLLMTLGSDLNNKTFQIRKWWPRHHDDGDGTRNLGSSSKRFRELFLTGQTINLGGGWIDSDGTGGISVSATGVTLYNGSKAGDNKLAVTTVHRIRWYWTRWLSCWFFQKLVV